MRNDVRLIRCPISVTGMVLTTISAALFLVVFLADLFGWHSNPYVGIVFFLILPGIFLLGLALIPLGALVERRRRARGLAPTELHWPRLDLNDPAQRYTAVVVFMLTVANVIIVSLAAFRGVEYMDSPQFCGQACHTAMKPEWAAYQDGPHSRVACTECHVGSGATSYAKSKVSGVRRLLPVSLGTYHRPITGPVRDMRPARETCEQCHWPEKHHGDKFRRVVEYADDEKSTESVTTLTVHVGGGSDRLGLAQGIHWHMNVGTDVEYVTTDDKRQVIPWVRVTDRYGAVREYTADGVTAEQIAKGERRRMDCIDCHNRPSHQIAATAERAVDETIVRGLLPRALPFVRRETVKAVKAAYPTQEAADGGIATALRQFYRSQLPQADPAQRQAIDQAVQAAGTIYRRSVFPEMNVTFGTYPSNIGHIDFPGCFRCYDDSHKTKDGAKISQDCDTCHTIS